MAELQTPILLIDDNPGDRRLIEIMLAEANAGGYQIVACERLEDGLRQSKQREFDLILLDLTLPDSEGLNTFNAVNSVRVNVPVIVLTGVDDDVLALQALKHGAQDYLVKGEFDASLLHRAIQYAIERNRLILQNENIASKLQQSEARFRRIFSENADGILILGEGQKVLFANPAAERILARNDGDLLGQSLDLPLDYDRVRMAAWKRDHNTPVFAEIRCVEIPWYGQKANLATLRDVSERVATDAQMRMQAAALDAVANAILIVDGNGAIIWANPAFTDLTGYSIDEVVGQNPRVLKSGYHDREFYQQLWETVLAGRVWSGELVNKRKDGSFYHEEMTITPITNESGEIAHFVAIKQDVTARKQSEITLQRRLDELVVLNAVALAGVEETDEDRLIERATAIVGDMFYTDHFGVILLADDRERLMVHSSYRGLPDGLEITLQTIREGVVGSVISEGRPRRISDVRQIPEYMHSTPGIRSELCVPLQAYGRTIGVLNAESAELDFFTEADERLMITLAGQLATAIEQIRNHQAEREQRLRAEALSDSALALTSSLALDQVLDQILDNIARVIPYEAASLMLNENGHSRVIRQRGFTQKGDADIVEGLTFPLAEDQKFLRMMETGEPFVIPDVQQSQYWKPMEHVEWIRSYLGVPIRKDETVFGFLNLDHSLPNFFTAAHAGALQSMAQQLAIALDNARLYSETEQRAAELSRLYNASGSLLSATTTNLDALSDIIVKMVRSEFGKSNCSLFLIVPGTNDLERIAATGEYADKVVRGQTLTLDGEGLVPLALRQRNIVNIPDVSRQPAYVPNWSEARSEMAVPLIVGDKVVGAIDVQSAELSAFSLDDERIISVFAERAALTIETTRLYQRQQRQLAFLEALHQIDLTITGSMDRSVTLRVILGYVQSQLDVDAVNVLMLNPHTARLECTASTGFRSSDIQLATLYLGDGLGGKVAQSGKVYFATCLDKDNCPDCVRYEIFEDEGFRQYYGLPLVAKGKTIGVMELYYRRLIDLHPEWESFADTLATQVAIAIENATLFESLEHSNLELSLAYDTTLEGWAKALEMRDQETEGHSRRVTELSIRLAKAMGIHGHDLVHLRRGAILHDIGKMGVPDNILQKKGPLTDDEWAIMRQHPKLAYEWLRPIKYLQPALEIPLCHHEKWDGSGYPDGLKGEQIPISARIFAIVDVWDALCSNRPYRDAWPADKIIAYIQGEVGKHFDPQVVETFISLISESEY